MPNAPDTRGPAPGSGQGYGTERSRAMFAPLRPRAASSHQHVPHECLATIEFGGHQLGEFQKRLLNIVMSDPLATVESLSQSMGRSTAVIRSQLIRLRRVHAITVRLPGGPPFDAPIKGDN